MHLQVSDYFIYCLCTVLDTAAGVWCDTKSVVTSPRTGRYSADAAGGDASVELTRRCRHAAAAVGDLIFIYGGLRGGKENLGRTYVNVPNDVLVQTTDIYLCRFHNFLCMLLHEYEPISMVGLLCKCGIIYIV